MATHPSYFSPGESHECSAARNLAGYNHDHTKELDTTEFRTLAHIYSFAQTYIYVKLFCISKHLTSMCRNNSNVIIRK